MMEWKFSPPSRAMRGINVEKRGETQKDRAENFTEGHLQKRHIKEQREGPFRVGGHSAGQLQPENLRLSKGRENCAGESALKGGIVKSGGADTGRIPLGERQRD